jgi:hypothetical protein
VRTSPCPRPPEQRADIADAHSFEFSQKNKTSRKSCFHKDGESGAAMAEANGLPTLGFPLALLKGA